MCTFHATDGALIVATASGVVSELVEDPELGYKIVIDHGNEYVTVYYNKGEPAVNRMNNKKPLEIQRFFCVYYYFSIRPNTNSYPSLP